MAGVRPRFERGSPLTFNANENIIGGQLVEAVSGGTAEENARIRVTTGVSATCLGVAVGDASAPDFANPNTTDAWGNPTVNHGLNPPNEVAVANQGVWDLTAAGAVAFGQLVTSAANGAVAALGGTPVVGTVVGRCVEPAGIADGAKGKILLTGAGA